MNRGILTFAHNTGWDYLLLAKSLAVRAGKFLNLPVTVITDQATLDSTDHSMAEFDSVIVVDRPESNSKHREPWLNKGRWSAFEISPYDDTLVLDSDYIINSGRILSFFELPGDFGCFRRAKYILSDHENERLSPTGPDTYWATGIRFQKSNRARQIFDFIGRIQYNYEYYSDMYGFMPYTYRNDYALTIALRTINGQTECPQDFFVGSLYNVRSNVDIIKVDDTTYKLVKNIPVNGTYKKMYLQLSNFDFHVLDKKTCMRLVNE